MHKIVLAVTGASGSIYAFRLLEKLHKLAETHLILSRAAEKTLFLETGRLAADLKALATFCYPVEDIASRLSSGSFRTDGMVITPCSMNTMGAIASGVCSNLLTRAADVTLKERRRLILMVRETPFHLGHLRSMVALTEMGAVIVTLSTPYYGISARDGSIVLHGIPSGSYRLNVWAENVSADRLDALSRVVVLSTRNTNLGTLVIETSGDLMSHHLNKFGESYNPVPKDPY